MQITGSLKEQIGKAVQTSMQIERYQSSRTHATKEAVKAFMELHCVNVSVQRKCDLASTHGYFIQSPKPKR